MKTKLIIIGLFALLLGSLGIAVNSCKHQQQERLRLDNNQRVLLSDIIER